MDDKLIQLKGVEKKFGKNLVLDSINLSIPENKITGIIGASGEGKTTILKLIVAFYKPNNGDILYSKRKISKDLKNIRNIFGFSTEDGSFHEKLTVLENLTHFGKLHRINKKDLEKRIKKILDTVELSKAKNTLAKNLSQGMKRRLDVAISLVHEPKVLIMDEPTADLDPLLRKQIIKLIKKINNEKTTIILTTQILTEMDELCHKIAILFDKKIVEEDTPAKIKKKYKASEMDEVFTKIFSKKKKIEKKKGNKKKKKRVEKEEEKSSKDQIDSDQDLDKIKAESEEKINEEKKKEK